MVVLEATRPMPDWMVCARRLSEAVIDAEILVSGLQVPASMTD